MSILALLAAGVGHLGLLALAGGPLGLGIAWLGSMAANKTVKLVAIAIGLLLLIGVSVGLTVHIERLEQDRAAFRALSGEVAALQAKYGCPARPAHERDLGACLTARAREAEKARADEVARLARAAAQAQADLAAATAVLDRQSADTEAFIDRAAPGRDGPVPGVLLDTWARERAARGVK